MNASSKYVLVWGLSWLVAMGCGDSGAATPDGGSDDDCTTVLAFPDPVLDALVHSTLGAAVGDPLSAAQLATITELTHGASTTEPIRSVDRIQCLTNLASLHLEGLYDGMGNSDGLQDATPLTSLTNLTGLTINYAEFDLAPLGELVQLEVLALDYAVPGSLESRGSLAALAPLVNLTTLDASDGCVEDIAALSNMTELVNLDLYSNCIADISALAGLTKLREVDLSDNFLDCLASQATLAALRGYGATVVDDC